MEQPISGSSGQNNSVAASLFTLWKLHELIEWLDKETVQEALDRFSCSRSDDVEQFIRSQAMLYEEAHKSRTYLLVWNSSFDSDPVNIDIFAYFTLSIADLSLPDGLTKSRKKDLNGLFHPRDDKLFGYLIGQLGKNDPYASTQLEDGPLLSVAIKTLDEHIQPWIGGRFVLVECRSDVPKVISYYQKYGFRLFPEYPDEPLAQLVYML